MAHRPVPRPTTRLLWPGGPEGPEAPSPPPAKRRATSPPPAKRRRAHAAATAAFFEELRYLKDFSPGPADQRELAAHIAACDARKESWARAAKEILTSVRRKVERQKVPRVRFTFVAHSCVCALHTRLQRNVG